MPFPRRLTADVLATMVFALASPAGAQEQSPWQSFISVSPVFETADLDGGGDLDVSGVLLRGGAPYATSAAALAPGSR